MLIPAALVVSLHGETDVRQEARAGSPAPESPSRAGRCADLPGQRFEQGPVRSSDSSLTRLIADGVRQSTTFARLAAAIGEHKAMVYVEWLPSMKGGLTGALVHDTFRGADGTRYLRVLVERGRAGRVLIATIAHELHHVLEFLSHGTDDFAAAYSALRADARQLRSDLRVYETDAAVAVGVTVSRELAACRRG